MLELSRHAATLSTRRLNAYPHALWVRLGVLPDARDRRSTAPRRAAAAAFYNAGILYGLVATLASVSLVVLAGFQLLWRVLELEAALGDALLGGGEGEGASAAAGAEGLARRAVDVLAPASSSNTSASSGLGSLPAAPTPDIGDLASAPLLSPLIPGITVPLWHLVPLLLALLLTQAIHEAGHALAAALSHITPLSTGIALLLPCMPSAFVALPSAALALSASELQAEGAGGAQGSAVPPPLGEQLRILSAGVWHNALTALLFLLGRCLLASSDPTTSPSPSQSPALISITAPAALLEPARVLLDYIFTLSLALAILNMLPLWGLDGEAFTERIALLLLRRRAGTLDLAALFRSAPAAQGEGGYGLGAGPWNGYAGEVGAGSAKDRASRMYYGGRLLQSQLNGSTAPSASSSSPASSSSSSKQSAQHSGWSLASLANGSSRAAAPDTLALRGRAAHALEEGEGADDHYAGSDTLDLEAGGAGWGSGGRFALTKPGAGPATVSLPSSSSSTVPAVAASGPSSTPAFASAFELQVLRALRTRTRAVFGLVAIAVFGGTVVLECVLALQ